LNISIIGTGIWQREKNGERNARKNFSKVEDVFRKLFKGSARYYFSIR
jgi:hypothetical protein